MNNFASSLSLTFPHAIRWMAGYGFGYTLLGELHYTIDSSLELFCNHGCNGTYSFGDDTLGYAFTEMNVDLNSVPQDLLYMVPGFCPECERHLRQCMTQGDDSALRDILGGEEILCNYLSYFGDAVEWEEFVSE